MWNFSAAQASSQAAGIVADDGEGLLEFVRDHARKKAHGARARQALDLDGVLLGGELGAKLFVHGLLERACAV